MGSEWIKRKEATIRLELEVIDRSLGNKILNLILLGRYAEHRICYRCAGEYSSIFPCLSSLPTVWQRRQSGNVEHSEAGWSIFLLVLSADSETFFLHFQGGNSQLRNWGVVLVRWWFLMLYLFNAIVFLWSWPPARISEFLLSPVTIDEYMRMTTDHNAKLATVVIYHGKPRAFLIKLFRIWHKYRHYLQLKST
jgi:hypothetical protein